MNALLTCREATEIPTKSARRSSYQFLSTGSYILSLSEVYTEQSSNKHIIR